MEYRTRWDRVALVVVGGIVALYLVWLVLKLVFWALGMLMQGLAYCLLGIIMGLCYIGPYIGPVVGGLLVGALLTLPLYLVFRKKGTSAKIPVYAVGVLLTLYFANSFIQNNIFIEQKLEPAQKVFNSGDLYAGLEMRNHTLADNGYIMLGDWRTDGQGGAIYFRCPWLSRYREPVVHDFTPAPEW